jgi:hypothetical protein
MGYYRTTIIRKKTIENVTTTFATICKLLVFLQLAPIILQLLCTFDHSYSYATTTFAIDDLII